MKIEPKRRRIGAKIEKKNNGLSDEFKIKMASSSPPKINATKIVLVKLGINNIGILVFFNYSAYLNGKYFSY